MEYALPFTKASGAGNDFVLLDNRDGWLPPDLASLARALCSRPFGIGADGMLLLEKSAKADFLMKYFNADGSTGGMCGNGGRCIARFASILGVAGEKMTFEALDFLYRAEITHPRVRLWMKEPTGFQRDIVVRVEGRTVSGHFIDTGAPHFVCLVDDPASLSVPDLGRELRFHKQFQPAGTNVDFVEVASPSSLRLRTYERGVEAETLACGTGSVASAIVCSHLLGMASPVTVFVRSGESLLVSFEAVREALLYPVLEGSAHMLFDGTVTYDDTRASIL